MELEEAASRIQTMLNFYNGLQKLKEVVDFARTLENLPKLEAERLAIADKAKKKMEDAQKALAKFEAEATTRMAEATAAYDALVLSNKSKVAELDAALAAKLESAQRQIDEANSNFSAVSASLAAETSALETRRDEVQKQLTTAENALAALRKKFDSLS